MTVTDRRCLLTFCVAVAFAAGCTDQGGARGVELSTAAVESGMTLALTVPEGTGPGEVSLRHPSEEVAAGGPSALAVAADGTVHLADTLAERIVRLRRDGSALTPIATPWPDDVQVDRDGRLYAWSRLHSRVSVFGRTGQQVDAVDVPRTMRLIRGLAATATGVVLRTGYQESVDVRVADLHRGLGEGVAGLDGERYRTIRRDGRARIEVVAMGGGNDPRWQVVRSLPVEVPTRLGSLTLVGVAEDGEVVVELQDVVNESPVEVERRVRRYGPDGSVRGETAVPRGLYAPPRALTLGEDGTVWALRPTLDGVEVWSWARGGAR